MDDGSQDFEEASVEANDGLRIVLENEQHPSGGGDDPPADPDQGTSPPRPEPNRAYPDTEDPERMKPNFYPHPFGKKDPPGVDDAPSGPRRRYRIFTKKRPSADDTDPAPDENVASPDGPKSPELPRRTYTEEEVSDARSRFDAAEEARIAAEEARTDATDELKEAALRLEVARRSYDEAAAAAEAVAEEVSDALLSEECFWNRMHGRLRTFRAEHGHCRVSRSWHSSVNRADDENRKLGVWVGKQRQLNRKKPKGIERHRIVALNKLRFDWDPIETHWEAVFQDLVAHKAKTGNFDVTVKSSQPLVHWISHQRCEYKKRKDGKHHTLTDEHRKRLDSINFEWQPHEKQFNVNLKLLRAYRAVFGNCHVPSEFVGNPQLSKWVDDMRKAYQVRKKRGSHILNEERIKILEDEGLSWVKIDVTRNHLFASRYNDSVPPESHIPLEYEW